MLVGKFSRNISRLCRGKSQFKFEVRQASTNPSVSETSEALKHSVNEEAVNEESLKKLKEAKPRTPKLDRNVDHRLTYGIASSDKLEAINRLLYASYHPDEPITRHLGLFKGLGSIPDADRRVKNSVQRNLSLFAYDKEGNEIGVSINNGYYRDDFMAIIENELETATDPAYKPFLAVHKELRSRNTHLFDELKTEKFFCISMVGVDPKFRGKGIATDLIRRSILLAGVMGFSGIMTEATGKYSQKAFSTIGMLKVNSLEYKDFEFEGKKVFEGMGETHTDLAFMKKKFFQSCLKHIL